MRWSTVPPTPRLPEDRTKGGGQNQAKFSVSSRSKKAEQLPAQIGPSMFSLRSGYPGPRFSAAWYPREEGLEMFSLQ